MTYQQALDFCAKDNATLPTITNFYQYHVLTHYLETQQDDWRYYDMVWINELDNDDCNVFVDSTVKSISCEFMLPAICEMDEHVHLSGPASVAELPKEVVYSTIILAVMLVLVFLLCCCWCNKTKQRKRERLERRDSIRISKSSLGSRSLASMASTGFSDINYRRRFINNPSRTGTITSQYRQQNGSSFDSLAEKRSLALHSSAEDDLRSYDAYNTNPMPGGAGVVGGLGSHLSPSGGRASFTDMHEVHYAGQQPVAAFGQQQDTSATVHSISGYDISYDNAAYRPDTRQSNGQDPASALWQRGPNQSVSQGPPGYQPKQNRPDSVSEMKRELKETLNSSDDAEDLNTTASESSSSGGDHQANAGNDYQTMYESSTFRPSPSSPQRQQQQPQRQQQTPRSDIIPSVPGYAKPFAHTTAPQRPFQPPPAPPLEDARSRRPLLETSLDEDSLQQPQRTRSVGHILETDLDADEAPAVDRDGRTLASGNGHSRSLGESGFPRLSLGPTMLETDM